MRRVKRIIFSLVFIGLLSGCAKSNLTMSINNDKSMNLELLFLVKSDLKNELSSNFGSTDLEKRDFKVTTTNDEDYSGYKITRKFDNIDNLSNGKNETIDISRILEENFDFNKLFSKKTSIFKDTYTANFIYTKDDLQQYYSNNTIDFPSISDLDIKYTVTLPNKAISNNASEKSYDLKKLSWTLSTSEDTKINYSFGLYNIKNIIIIVVGLLAFLILIIIIINIIKNKRGSKKTLIYKTEDFPNESANMNNNNQLNEKVVENTISTQDVNKDNESGMQVLESLEFELPENVLENKMEDVEVKVNTFDYNRRPDFVKSDEPNKFVFDSKEDKGEFLQEEGISQNSVEPPKQS